MELDRIRASSNVKFDALEARNEPLDLAAFDPKPATDEQRQASHYYKQAVSLLVELEAGDG